MIVNALFRRQRYRGALEVDKKQKVLIVDGNIAVTRFLRLNLERSGYEVSVVHDIEQAEALAARHKVDVVALATTDTPGTREMVSRIRKALACPVLVYGLSAQTADEKSGYHADQYTDQFLDPEAFLEALKTAAGSKPPR